MARVMPPIGIESFRELRKKLVLLLIKHVS